LLVAQQGGEDLVGQFGLALLTGAGQGDEHPNLFNMVDPAATPDLGADFECQLGILVAFAQTREIGVVLPDTDSDGLFQGEIGSNAL